MMQVIALVECEDCGSCAVIDPDFITIFEIYEEYVGVTLCSFCERPITSYVSLDNAIKMINLGVGVLSWTNTKIDINKIRGRIKNVD